MLDKIILRLAKLSPKQDILLIILVGMVINFTFIASNPLWNRDDSRHAEIAREMIESGDWVTPRLYYVPHLEKPVLTYYFIASSMLIFGQNEFGARFAIALLGLLTALVTYLLAKRAFNRKIALLASLLLLTSSEFVILSRFLTTDMVLTFFISLSYYFAFRYLMDRKEEEPSYRPLWGILLSASLSCTVLTKGFVGLVVVVFPICIYLIWTRKFTPLWKFPYLRSLLVAFSVLAPWHIAIYQQTPQFYKYFYYTRNIKALVNSNIHHPAPWYILIAYIAVGFMPWSFFLFFSLIRNRKNLIKKGSPEMLLFLWLGVNVVFFAMAASKLPTYILPLFPLFAIFTAVFFERGSWEFKKWEKRITLAFWGILALSGILFEIIFYYIAIQKKLAVKMNFFIYSGLAIFLLVIGCGLACYYLYKNQGQKSLYSFWIFFFLALLPLTYSLSLVSAIRSSKEMTLALKKILKKDDKIFNFHDRDHSSFFYLRRRIPHIGDLGRIGHGTLLEPSSQYFMSYKQVPQLLKSKGRIFILCHQKDYVDKFVKWYPSRLYWVVIKKGSYIVISNRPLKGAP